MATDATPRIGRHGYHHGYQRSVNEPRKVAPDVALEGAF